MMPAYDYRCRQCVEVFEARHSMTGLDRHLVKCPVCGTGDISRIILHVPATFIWWKDARSSPTGDVSGMQPHFRAGFTRGGKRRVESAEDFGGEDAIV